MKNLQLKFTDTNIPTLDLGHSNISHVSISDVGIAITFVIADEIYKNIAISVTDNNLIFLWNVITSLKDI